MNQAEWTIRPVMRTVSQSIVEAWQNRRLFGYFARECRKLVTRRTSLGNFWLVSRPVSHFLPHLLLFGYVLRFETEMPFPVYFMAGMLMWYPFDQVWFWSSRGIDANRKILQKLYFPRIILPVSHCIIGLIDILIVGMLFIGTVFVFWILTGYIYVPLRWELLWAPLAMMVALGLALGLGLFFCVWAAHSRDAIFSIRIILQAWYLLTPIAYPSDLLLARAPLLAYVNPLFGPISVFRDALLGGEVHPLLLVYPAVLTTIVLLLGLRFFSLYERDTIDMV